MNDCEQCPTEGGTGLLTLLIRSGRLAETRLDSILADAGLSFVQWRALDVVTKARSPISLSSLASELGCVRSNVTQLADKLEVVGAFKRMVDAGDRRSITIELTETGRTLHKLGLRALESAIQSVFASMTEHDRSALKLLLGRLISP